MNYSFSTVLMAILASNLLLIVLHLLFTNSKLMISAGYKIIGFIVILTLLRLFIPFEFPFVQNIYLPKKLAEISVFIQRIRFSLFGIDISIWTIFTGIWLTVSVFRFIQYICHYRKTRALIAAAGIDVTNEARYSDILRQLNPMDYAKFQIIEMNSLPSPMIFSFFHPCILLPANNAYTSEELTFILGHEVSHYRHGDLLLKFLVQLLALIYWWNPVSHLITKHLNAVLEIHVDQSLTRDDPVLIERYLSCLMKLKKEANYSPQCILPDTLTLSINDTNDTLLTKRFEFMTKRVKSGMICRSACLLLGFSIWLSSYFFTFEARVRPTECDGSPVFNMTEKNSYIIEQEDGTYHIYWNNQHIETVESLEYYDSSIPIYSTKEEVYEN